MTELLTRLQAAARLGVTPSIITRRVKDGRLTPVAQRKGPTGMMDLFRPEDVDSIERRVGGRPKKPRPPKPPIERLAELPDPDRLPPGLARLENAGRFRRVIGGVMSGGAYPLGEVQIGADWLRVYRSESGVVYHQQAEWMADDPDWMEHPAHAETLAALYSKEDVPDAA